MILSESELKQLELLKRKTPVERFLMMSRLIAGQIEVMKAGLKFSNPLMNDEELERWMKIRMKKIYSLRH